MLAVDRDNTKPLSEGVLAVVNNQIDQTTGTIQLKATFSNEDQKLWPGQFVNARLLVTTRKDGLGGAGFGDSAGTEWLVCLRDKTGSDS